MFTEKKKKSINQNHSWLLLEFLILTPCHIITIWFYHHRIQKRCSVSDPCRSGSQELGKVKVTKLPRLSGDRLAAAWPYAALACGGKVEPGCGCWQWLWGVSCPPRGQLEAESMTHGAAFSGCSHHITASDRAGKRPEAEENSLFLREPSGWRKCSWLCMPTVPLGTYWHDLK